MFYDDKEFSFPHFLFAIFLRYAYPLYRTLNYFLCKKWLSTEVVRIVNILRTTFQSQTIFAVDHE